MIACSCLSAFNQNFFKNAFIILITYRLAEATGHRAATIISIAQALFILPFFLFSGIAGTLSDHYPKQRVVLVLKATEMLLYLAAFACLASGNIWALLTVIGLIGTQAAFYSPVKYAILPSLLTPHEMIAGNGVNEAGTYLAILTGTMLGGLLVLHEYGTWMVGSITLIVALLGIWASRYVPDNAPGNRAIAISLNPVSSTWHMLKHAMGHKRTFVAILGISWFWTLGALYLLQLPLLAKDVFGLDETIVTLLYACFSIGICIGSLLCHRLLKDELHMRYIPAAILGISVFGLDLWWASLGLSHTGDDYRGWADFFHTFTDWRLSFDFLMLAILGGIFIVPLYTMLQVESVEADRARTIASNNIVNAFFIALSALVIGAAYDAFGAKVQDILLAAALLNLPVVWLIHRYVR